MIVVAVHLMLQTCNVSDLPLRAWCDRPRVEIGQTLIDNSASGIVPGAAVNEGPSATTTATI